ncbi:MAG: 2-C-methyl-D-erythritol 4-phosphate cytidylyltransferase [Proteobacteria bacterium]|nr:2-C-methyl-D-erythritol 4-phosphate cytidylyltransferase [Pseudomonadota bacterium]MBU2228602.1 2-C-methyl-D-erythritol 4-phosphate cytidylyltransferase [Pseudomonadota bacterium]
MKTVAIIPAGGAGQRMGGRIPKQYLPLGGIPVLVRTLQVFQKSPLIDEIFLVAPEGDIPEVREAVAGKRGFSKVSVVVAGGAERQDSVRNALAHLREEHGIVLVHDAVRPFVSEELIRCVVDAAEADGAATVGVPVKDTVKEVHPAGWVIKTVTREGLWLTHTPQAFRKPIILAAHERAKKDGFHGTDDASLVERMGGAVRMVPGDCDNIKVTTPEDLALGEVIIRRLFLNCGRQEGVMRIGFGYDSHRLVAGRRLVLGGKTIPYERGMQGHSDADVLLHAVCDAILGAIGEGDIGRQFPDTDHAYRDISSMTLLDRVGTLAAAKDCKICNIDSTIILEKPKLAPYLGEMAENIAGILRIPPERVSVKAKTNEGMGLVGAGEGAAAFAVVTVGGGSDS